MEISQEQDDFEQRWFRRYDCGDALGDWEILAYAMLLEHASDLLSNGPPGQAKRGKGGRKKEWDSERVKFLAAEVARVQAEAGAPSVRRTRQGALRHLLSQDDFRRRLGLKDADAKSIKTLANRLPPAEEHSSPGNGEEPNPGS